MPAAVLAVNRKRPCHVHSVTLWQTVPGLTEVFRRRGDGDDHPSGPNHMRSSAAGTRPELCGIRRRVLIGRDGDGESAACARRNQGCPLRHDGSVRQSSRATDCGMQPANDGPRRSAEVFGRVSPVRLQPDCAALRDQRRTFQCDHSVSSAPETRDTSVRTCLDCLYTFKVT